jgi:hypothetical protein
VANSLSIPKTLEALIEKGFWPRTPQEAMRQNLHCLVDKQLIHCFAPEEEKIFFLSPPFCTVSQVMKSEESFWLDTASAVHEIDPELTLLIGDFGLGSDAPIALDYRKSFAEPQVIRLKWSGIGNHWVEIAQTFDQFASLIGAKL